MILITVMYATREHIWSVNLDLAPGSSVEEAIKKSGFLVAFPEQQLELLNCGIFGRRVSLNQLLQEGDRIEVYRNLFFDPKQSRRRRAVHRQKIRNIKKKMPINDATV
jgi:putative ubiquitin-RnfH superfamily antitoxin RatB of RatAB toxin-antitoxin module